MVSMRCTGLLSLLVVVKAHMPAGAGDGTRADPTDLGDPTTNSWAIFGDLNPGAVKHYKFSITDEAAAMGKGSSDNSSDNKNRFYLGMYVPGGGVPGFTYYVAVFGMHNDTVCERWGDGWGRRLSGGDDHAHDDDQSMVPYRATSDGTAWLLDSDKIPERVIGSHDAMPHDHDDDAFDYHDSAATLAFVASPRNEVATKFESFSPTLFKPRGSCIANFPRGGEYRLAVWGETGQDGPKKFSVGIGLAERDVFAVPNLMTFDYTLYSIQTWNDWSPAALLLPMILLPLAFLAMAFGVKAVRPAHFGTVTGVPTPFRAIVLCASGMILGHMLTNIAILIWATGNAHSEARELTFPLVIGIFMPLISGILTLFIGFGVPFCCCCCPSARKAQAHFSYRIVVGLFGVLHLFLHCGYLIAPVLLIVAAILPPKVANAGYAPPSPTQIKGLPSA